MKLENYLARHLYNVKELTLQGIGKFELSPDFVAPVEGDKDFVMPQNAISFTYDSRAQEDDALVNYIVQQTKKIKPLASADLDSYLMLGKQFLNIGKPFKIEGIGSLEKNQTGQYFFTQGIYVNQKVESTLQSNMSVNDGNAVNEISFASKPKEEKSNKKLALLISAIIIAGLIGGTAWYLITNKENKSTTATVGVKQKDTSTTTILSTIDTTKKDTISKAPTNVAVNPNSFEVVIKEYNTLAKANERLNLLKIAGHNVSVFTTDSIKYKIALQVAKPLSDSVYVLDSLRRFFGGKPVLKN
jgi:hypothetical protein